MPSKEKVKKKRLGVVPARAKISLSELARARIQKMGLRFAVAPNAKTAKKRGKKSEAAFSLFGALKGFFSFLNSKLGAGIPEFNAEDGNVKLATNRMTNVTVVNDRDEVSLDLRGKKTVYKVNNNPPVEV